MFLAARVLVFLDRKSAVQFNFPARYNTSNSKGCIAKNYLVILALVSLIHPNQESALRSVSNTNLRPNK